MTKFTHHGRVFPGVGPNFQLMTESKNEYDNLWQVSSNVVSDARMLLQHAKAQLNAKRLSDKVIKYAHRYFLTEKNKLSAADLAKIQQTVTLVHNGLNNEDGDVALKVGTENPGTMGVVTSSRNVANHKWSYHNNRTRAKDGQVWSAGAIHVSASTIVRGRLAVVTLVHEASHKYAGTLDYAYFEDDGKEAAEVRDATTDQMESVASGLVAFDDKAKALVNADSYGWFVVKVGRSHSDTFSSMYSD